MAHITNPEFTREARAAGLDRRRREALPWFRCNRCGHAFNQNLVLDTEPNDVDAPAGICPTCQEEMTR